VSQGLERVRQAARQRKKEKFTALLHHVTIELLREAFLALKRQAAPGVDGVTWQDYEANLEGNLQGLYARVQCGTYRAQPVRRRFIPKPGSDKQRPLGIAALEDKIVQRALVAVLNAIYEEDFLGFSYGFRPGRSQHDALDALSVAICETRVNWILDADIRSFFDGLSQQWLVRFLRHRIGDERVIRLVQKGLKAGVLEAGEWSVSETGTPQGAVATRRTQEITSSSSDRLRCIVRIRFLICVVRGNMLRTHVARHRLRKGSACEQRLRTACRRSQPQRGRRSADRIVWV
jgi:retron-type reverse transcriptase